MQSDASFNELYPLKVQMLDNMHWTPLHVARRAAGFLGDKGAKVLDIGSGVGKFCLAAAYYAQDAQFYGIEQRAQLVEHALKAQQAFDIPNVSFIHANLTETDLRDFDHFYFYNSFQEVIDPGDKIDETTGYSPELYDHYIACLNKQLQQMPQGCKLVTFHRPDELQPGFELADTIGELDFWIKG